MELKGGMRRNAQRMESDSEEENSEPSHHPHIDVSNPTPLATNSPPALAPNQTTHLEHLTLIESKEEAYGKVADVNQATDKQSPLEEALGTK